MEELSVSFELTTPVFMAGADASSPELRAPSIKGLLRFWYRAIDPEFRQYEASLFGGTGKGEGQSRFLLRIASVSTGAERWNHGRYDGMKGMHYITFPFKPPKESDPQRVRRYIFSQGVGRITLDFLFRKPLNEPDRKRLLAAIWLLGHVGGVGARSRRGFGTLALHSWALKLSKQRDWPELEQLPLAHQAASPAEWLQSFSDGLRQLKEWFPRATEPGEATHTVVGPGARFRLDTRGHDRNAGFEPWEHAINAAGGQLRRFRLRWNLNDKGSDYHRVKRHIVEVAQTNGSSPDPRALLSHSPERVAFGLPITFRFKATGNVTLNLTGTDHSRNASPLIIRIVEIGGRCYPFFILLPAPLLGPQEKIQADVRRDKETLLSRKLDKPDVSILDHFWQGLRGEEVRW